MINQAGIDLIKRFEGCKLDCYLDIEGVPTIGWGATGPRIQLGLTWTQEAADADLGQRLTALVILVKRNLTQNLTDNQFSALICLGYNIGAHALLTSTLIRRINSQDLDVGDEFLRWDHADGTVVSGLLARRTAEKELYET